MVTLRDQIDALHELSIIRDKFYGIVGPIGGAIVYKPSDAYEPHTGITVIRLGVSNGYYFHFRITRAIYHPNRKAINRLARRWKKVITKVSDHWKIPK